MDMPSQVTLLSREPWTEKVPAASPLSPPTSWFRKFRVAPSVIEANAASDRLVGSASKVSRVRTVCAREFWTSTTGLSPVTVMVSSTDPTIQLGVQHLGALRCHTDAVAD